MITPENLDFVEAIESKLQTRRDTSASLLQERQEVIRVREEKLTLQKELQPILAEQMREDARTIASRITGFNFKLVKIYKRSEVTSRTVGRDGTEISRTFGGIFILENGNLITKEEIGTKYVYHSWTSLEDSDFENATRSFGSSDFERGEQTRFITTKPFEPVTDDILIPLYKISLDIPESEIHPEVRNWRKALLDNL